MCEIPKIIHYCWFGKKNIPKNYLNYIEKWKKALPNYEFILWNEDNFPINEFKYAEEAYNQGKMAFVSDVARIYALNKMGGIYLDTDVEIVKPFDTIIKGEKAVLGTESVKKTIGTGFMAFCPNHEITKYMLDFYINHHFVGQDENFSNTFLLANIVLDKYNIQPEDEIQRNDHFVLYPSDYFTAYNGITGRTLKTENTYCIHHFAASWFSLDKRIKRLIKKFFAIFNK